MKRLRYWLMCLLWGRRTTDYMIRSLSQDPRLPRAKMADIVVRKDGHEVRIEADWLKTLSSRLPLVRRVAQPGELAQVDK